MVAVSKDIVNNIILSFSVDDERLGQVNAAADKILDGLNKIGGKAAETSADVQKLAEIEAALGRVNSIDNLAKQFANLHEINQLNVSTADVLEKILRSIGSTDEEINRAVAAMDNFVKSEEEAVASAEMLEQIRKAEIREEERLLEIEKERMNYETQRQKEAIGYGQTGGMIGPAENVPGGIGYTDIPAEGLRRTGSAITQLGGGQAGFAVRLLGDLQQISKEADVVAGALETLPGVMGQVALGGAAVAGSFGAIIAVAAPFAALIGVGVLALHSLNETLKESNENLARAEESVKTYFDVVGSGTADTINKQISEYTTKKQGLDELIKTNDAAVAQGTASAIKQFGVLGAGLLITAENAGAFGGSLKDVNDETQKAKDESRKLAGEIDGLTRAENSAAVAASTATANLNKLADLTIAKENREAQDMQLSADAGEKRLTLLQSEQKSLEDGLRILSFGDKNNPEIIAKQKLLEQNKEEQDFLENTAIPAAKAKEEAAANEKAADEALIKASKDLIDIKKQEASDQKMSLDAQKDRLMVLQEEAKGYRQGLDVLEHGHSLTPAVLNQMVEYQNALEKNKNEQKLLTDVLIPQSEAAKAAADAIKEQTKAVDDWLKTAEKVQANFAKFNNEMEALDVKESQGREDIQKKSADKISDILTQNSNKYLDLEQQYADKRVDIAQKAVDAATDAYTKLVNKEQDDFINLGRQQQKDSLDLGAKIQEQVISDQERQVKDLKEHLSNLERIRKSTYLSDMMALLDVNFLQLAKNRLTKSGQINEEDTRFTAQQEDRQSSLGNQINADVRNYQRQAAARITAYNNQIEDEKRQYSRELQQLDIKNERELEANDKARKQAEIKLQQDLERQFGIEATARERNLRDLTINIAREKEAKTKQYEDEYRLLIESMTQQRTVLIGFVKGFVQGLAPVVVNAGQNLIGNFLKSITGRADGGPLDSLESSMVNEPWSSGNESFTNPYGQTTKLPGFGIFTPMSSGHVNKGFKPDINIQHTWNIKGDNAVDIARKLKPMMQNTALEVINMALPSSDG